MHARRINDEVYVCEQPIVKVSRDDIEKLKSLAAGTRRQRARLCAHPNSEDALHEMLIVLRQSTYVRPHRHFNKSESFHVVEGALTVVIFTDYGQVREVIPMGAYGSGRQFYYRLGDPAYHTVLLDCNLAVIHETTNGPFNAIQTDFAPWAPREEDLPAARTYQAEIVKQAAAWCEGSR